MYILNIGSRRRTDTYQDNFSVNCLVREPLNLEGLFSSFSSSCRGIGPLRKVVFILSRRKNFNCPVFCIKKWGRFKQLNHEVRCGDFQIRALCYIKWKFCHEVSGNSFRSGAGLTPLRMISLESVYIIAL
jgi:hypothetical protein